MLESHETQKKILSEVKYFTCPAYGKFCNQSRGLATLQLEAELHHWRACFREYTAAQKAYVQALHGWLSKFIVPEVEFYSRRKNVAVPFQVNGPPLFMICNDWLTSLRKLPDKTVSLALKSVVKDVKALWIQQNKEQQQKRKVESLTKELDRRYLGSYKLKTKLLELQVTDYKSEEGTVHEEECMMEKSDHLETLRRKLEVEKEKRDSCMQETQRMTLNGLQSGFSLVLESLTEFSKASQKMYNDLVTFSENSEKTGNFSYIEGGCNVEDNCNSHNGE